MTDKEKLIKIKSLADKMYNAAFNLTTDASLLRKAMEEYQQFVINEYHKEEQIIKELQEEPISNNYSVLLPCIYNRTLEERVKYCKYCSAACEGRVKELISEDLEKAANDWDAKASFTPFYMALDDNGNPNGVKQDYTTHAESFKAGAKWQKQKDSILVNEDLEKASYLFACKCHPLKTECSTSSPNREVIEAFKTGAKWQKEQMMKNIIDAQCFGFQGAALFSFRLPSDNYLVGSKVKVIVIKEN